MTKEKWKKVFFISLLVIGALFILSGITSGFIQPEDEITTIYEKEPTSSQKIASVLFGLEVILMIVISFFACYALGRLHNDYERT